MIELQNLTKRYGQRTAVDHLSVTVRPGMVTGFLGPNGAGKSTTMRLILGLDRPDEGRVLVDGRPYVDHPAPMTKIGAQLDATSVPPTCSGRNHLLGLAATRGIGARRVDAVIAMTGLESVARKAFKTYSLGMGQRLGIAAALLGDPEILIFDEPVNGLDPEGVLWVRRLARQLAADGRTVFLSSHLMSEMALTADHLIIIGQGRLLEDAPMSQFLHESSEVATHVRSPQLDRLAAGLVSPTVRFTRTSPTEGILHGLAPLPIGTYAAQYGLVLESLEPVTASLEEAYLRLTDQAVEFRTADPATALAA